MADAPEDTADAPETILANLHFIAPQFTAPQRHGSRNLDAPLPIRRRQRKPDRRNKASDMDSDISSRAARKKTPGRRGRPAAAIKAKRVAAAPVAAGDDYTQRIPPSPKQPLPPRELPARHTPKKMWHVSCAP